MTTGTIESPAPLTHTIECADCLEFLGRQGEGSVDLVFGSPPYMDARTYDDGTLPAGATTIRDCQEWVDWMLGVTAAAVRVSRGLVLWVVSGVQRDLCYWPGCEGLCWEWWKRGNQLWRPCIWWKVDENDGGTGIPGSGGKQWLRNDWEYVLAFKREGWLPWADPLVMGHEPIYDQVGGAMSNRTVDGRRSNDLKAAKGTRAWHDGTGTIGARRKNGKKRSEENPPGTTRRQNGEYKKTKAMYTRNADGSRDTERGENYVMPKIANPGNVLPIQCHPFIEVIEHYAILTGADTDALLRDLRSAVDAKNLLAWWAGIYSRIQEAEILQSLLQGDGSKDTQRPEIGRASASREEDCSKEKEAGAVREVRPNDTPGGSPSGRGCDQQRYEQSDGSLPLVPSKRAQERGVQGARLREAILRPGVLLNALPAIQSAWRSVAEAGAARRENSSGVGMTGLVVKSRVGGGHMGSRLAHFSEAPFPEALAEFFVQCFAPPGGKVLDCFSGSGTTAAMAKKHNRNFAGCDLRRSQVDLGRKRLDTVTPMMF